MEALLLIENDRQLNFRIQSRGVIEVAMYLIALDRNAAFVEKMKDDDYKSRHSRGGLDLKAGPPGGTDDVRKMLEDFVGQGLQGAKAIQMGELLEGSEFERLYSSYRDICGDAAHVSMPSLNRHYVEDLHDRSAALIIDPALDEDLASNEGQDQDCAVGRVSRTHEPLPRIGARVARRKVTEQDNVHPITVRVASHGGVARLNRRGSHIRANVSRERAL